MNFRCWLTAWIAGWATSVFLPSLWIAFLGLSAPVAVNGTGFSHLPGNSWQVADDVGPAVKLMIGSLLLAGLLGLNRLLRRPPAARLLGGGVVGVAAVLTTIGFIPAGLSRGFALALAGERFDPTLSLIYLLGGVIGGVTTILVADRCTRQGRP
jgi:hypothetical protein